MDLQEISKLKKKVESEITNFVSEKINGLLEQTNCNIKTSIYTDEVHQAGMGRVYTYVIYTNIEMVIPNEP